ncbi:hypothetical protein AB0M87_32420 [Streptomyces sp. NPDC051320]|uniref:hypothetical protein n=1 Tax=Streptomyces sp. NPDC051320 TaxID=3154644 RepID=UPI00343245F0
MSHEHDLALALRELLERAAAGHGTRREKIVAARARAGAAADEDGAVWGILYGQQPPAGVLEPDGEDLFADDGEDKEACAGDGGVGIGPTDGALLSGPSAGLAQEADTPAPVPPRVTVYDPVEESLRW